MRGVISDARVAGNDGAYFPSAVCGRRNSARLFSRRVAIRKNPGITQAGVCRIVGIDKGAVARQTANLEAKGYLIRKENPGDGRSQLLFATEKAEGLKHSKAYVEALFYEWLLQPLPEAEKQEFARLLDRLYRRCKAESRADFPEMNQRMKGCRPDEA